MKLPALLREEEDEPLFERMSLIAELSELWLEQYSEFLGLRLSRLWEQDLMPAVRRWLAGETSLSRGAYHRLIRKTNAKPTDHKPTDHKPTD